jgi:hypothetical protein
VRKLRREWEKRRKIPDWKLLMDLHQFTLIPIVPSDGKAHRIHLILRNSGIKVRPHVETELQKILGGQS